MTRQADDLDQLLEPAAPGFDDTDWRAVDAPTAVVALQGLVDQIGRIHQAGVHLDGIKRPELSLDADRGSLRLASAPRAAQIDALSGEQLWRDARLIGELAYENAMDQDYPGGHDMSAILQETEAMAEMGLTQPGLTQVVAICVSPYGQLALLELDELRQALDQFSRELDPPITLSVGSRSTVGNYIFRRNNQDACAHQVLETTAGSARQSVGFFCVADGIGGIQDGQRASALAVRSACAAFGRALAHYGADAVARRPAAFARAVVKVTSQRLALAGEFDARQNRGGTTFTGLLIAGGRAGLGHVGDSRALLVRRGQTIQLSRDHTLASILGRLDATAQTQARREMNQRTISRFLSTGAELEAGRIDGVDPGCDELVWPADGRAEQGQTAGGFVVEPDDLFLLTSDGVHDLVAAQRRDQLIAVHRRRPRRLADAMVQAAVDAVGRDNATALAVLVEAGRR